VKEKNLIQLVLAFDSSFLKGKKTLHDGPFYCFSCLLLDLVELVLVRWGVTFGIRAILISWFRFRMWNKILMVNE
jgi:hypothetical protein